MKKLLVLLFLFFSCFAFSQSFQRKHSFDVLNYKFYLDLYNCYGSSFPKKYYATNTITFKVDSVLNSIKLDAVNSSLTIDSVGLAGGSFLHSSDILTVNLDKTYNPGDTAKVKICYHHNDITSNMSDTAIHLCDDGFIFTDCEPEFARRWLPCWDKPSDKATTDFTAKVPVNVKLGSNGILKDSTIIGDTLYYHWVSRDPMSTYLIYFASKVNYNLQTIYWHKHSNPNDSIPIVFYYSDGEDISPIRDSVISVLDFFSEMFGEYPFEKIGYAGVNSFTYYGCMENQTLINMVKGSWSCCIPETHEMSHQWFGDLITCATWADLVLNEGFATYCDALWKEFKEDYVQYKLTIENYAKQYMNSNPGRPITDSTWAIKTPDFITLFYYPLTYQKGACVLHMLRYVIGDSLFFKSLKEYATDTAFMYSNATVTDFKNKVESISKQDLDWFFDEWIYKPNHPKYSNTISIDSIGAGNWNVKFTAKQTQTNPPFFKMPIELQFSFKDMTDTIIRVMNDSNNQTFLFNISKKPVGVSFDPFNNIVLKVVDSPVFCSGTKTLTSITDTIEDGSGIFFYVNNSSCNWDIQPSNNPQSITLHFLEFDTENINDKLDIWDGGVFPNQIITTYSGSVIPADLVCNTKRVKLKFNTNSSKTFLGWKLIYTTDVGVEEKSDDIKSLSVYPNPVNDILKINLILNSSSEINIELKNIIGKIVYEENIGSTSNIDKSIDLSSFAKGVYVLEINTAKTTLRKKVVIE